jgi:hypothetical protein
MKRILAFILLSSLAALADTGDIPLSSQISPQALRSIMQSNARKRLLILNVGPRVLYYQAHIAGAEYIGPTSDPRGIAKLQQRVKSVSRNKQIVLYCGCCPWDRCPNVKPAFAKLKKLGFRNVKVLHIANNIGADWVDKDYPVERGQ